MADLTSEDVVSIGAYFKELPDPRCNINRKHLLGDLIVICICAVIAGADGPKAIGVWAASNAEWLRRYLALSNGIPSHDTLGRLLALLKPSAFQACFQEWIGHLRRDDAPEATPSTSPSRRPPPPCRLAGSPAAPWTW